jgi:hypothetical protein
MSLVIVLFSALLSFAAGSYALTPRDTFSGGPTAAPSHGAGVVGSRTVAPSDTTGGGPMLAVH